MGRVVEQAVLRIGEAQIAGGVARGAGHDLHQAKRPCRADHGRVEFGFPARDGQDESGGRGQVGLGQRGHDRVIGAHDLVARLCGAFADQDGQIGIAEVEGEIAQHPRLFARQAFGQMRQEARGQAAFTRLVEQETGVKDRIGGERRLPPVAVGFRAEKGGIDRQSAAILRKLAVEARLIACAQRIGLGSGGGIACGVIGAAEPIARAAHGDGGKDGVAEGGEMGDGGVVTAEPVGAIAREPFEFREIGRGLRPVQVMVRGIGVAGVEVALAHHVARQIGAAVGPGERTAQRRGGAGAFGHQIARRIPETRADAPQKALIGKARIIGEIGGHRLDQGVDTGLARAQRQTRLGQPLPAFGDEREHGAGALCRALPQEVVEPVDVVAARVQDRAEGGAERRRLVPGHGDGRPCADRLGLGGGPVAARLMGAGQRQRASAG